MSTEPSRVEVFGDIALLFLSGEGGCVAMLDARDIGLVSGRRWHAAHRAGGLVYARCCDTTGEYLHRLVIHAPPRQWVDHHNGCTLDNRRKNLRFASRSENAANMRVRTGKRFKGISFEPTRRGPAWVASVHAGGKRVFRRLFWSEIEAALAYDTAAKQFFGEFARLNFPDEVLPSHAQQHERSLIPCPTHVAPRADQ